MNLNLAEITANSVVIVPIIIALVQAIKLTGWVRDHFAPLVTIAIGIVIGFLSNHNNPDLTETALSGAIYGLMASGLYSGVKTTMVARMRMKEEKKNAKFAKSNQDNC